MLTRPPPTSKQKEVYDKLKSLKKDSVKALQDFDIFFSRNPEKIKNS